MKRFWPTLILIRLALAFFTRNWHVPDETWQGPEIAHKFVFGAGYQTWEWRQSAQIRSFLHPLLFVPPMFSVSILEFLFGRFLPGAIVVVPRLLQAVISLVGDFFFVRFFEQRRFGAFAGEKFAVIYVTNVFLNYCSSRTLVNTLETTLTSIALFAYPWNGRGSKWALGGDTFYVLIIALSFVIRSTTAIFWLPLTLLHIKRLWTEKRLVDSLFKRMIPTALLTLLIAGFVDGHCYGSFFVPVSWNFFKLNISEDVSSFYGRHPFHWYLSNALPLYVGVFIWEFVNGFWAALRGRRGASARTLAFVVTWTIIVYSMIPHKEHRFLLPLVPSFCLFSALKAPTNPIGRIMKMSAFAIQLPIVVYLCCFHQVGNFSLVKYLNAEIKANDVVLVLGSCHSVPYQSHLHRPDLNEDALRLLNCEPDLTKDLSYVEESEEFFQDPSKFVLELKRPLPTHIAVHDTIAPKVSDFLVKNDYKVIERFFHSLFVDGRQGKEILLFKR